MESIRNEPKNKNPQPSQGDIENVRFSDIMSSHFDTHYIFITLSHNVLKTCLYPEIIVARDF